MVGQLLIFNRRWLLEVYRQVNKIQSAIHASVEFGYLFYHESTPTFAGFFSHGLKSLSFVPKFLRNYFSLVYDFCVWCFLSIECFREVHQCRTRHPRLITILRFHSAVRKVDRQRLSSGRWPGVPGVITQKNAPVRKNALSKSFPDSDMVKSSGTLGLIMIEAAALSGHASWSTCSTLVSWG